MCNQSHNPFLDESSYLSIQHIERYRFAIANLSPGQKVLDAACGTGYGTAMLSEYGCNVVGMDIDDLQLIENKEIWGQCRFVRGDMLAIPFKDESFDAVVSFETIEHVLDGKLFLQEVHRVLRPGGALICSTPNIKYTQHPYYHLKEYTPEEFYQLFERWFPQVFKYGQYITWIDRLMDVLHRLLRGIVSKVLDIVDLKEIIKSKLRACHMAVDPSCRAKVDREDGRLFDENLTKESNAEFYSVRNLCGTNLLRIMIALVYKGR